MRNPGDRTGASYDDHSKRRQLADLKVSPAITPSSMRGSPVGPGVTLFRPDSIVFSLSLLSRCVGSVSFSDAPSTSVFRLQDTCHLPQSPLVVTHTQRRGETAGVTVRLPTPHSNLLSLITVQLPLAQAQKQGPAGLSFLLTLHKTVGQFPVTECT